MITIREIIKLAKEHKVRMRGDGSDIEKWNGYSHEPYTYVAISLDFERMWNGVETGNFVPIDCYYTVITKYSSSTCTAIKLSNQIKLSKLERDY